MKKKRHSVEQITAILKQAESGAPVGDLCRQVGIAEQTFYRWKKVYGGMLPSEARELKRLRELAQTRVRFGYRPSGTGTKYLLAGLLTCATCGGSLEVSTRKNGHGRMRFIGCSTHHRRGRSICGHGLTVSMQEVEAHVLESCQASLLEPRIWSRALDYAVGTSTGTDPPSGIDRLEEALQRVETELARLAEAVAQGCDLAPLLASRSLVILPRIPLVRRVTNGRQINAMPIPASSSLT